MSGYVARKYDNGDYTKMILNELNMPTLKNTKALYSMAEDVEKGIYKEDVNAYANDNRLLTRSAKTLYSLVLGQFTESLRTKIKVK